MGATWRAAHWMEGLPWCPRPTSTRPAAAGSRKLPTSPFCTCETGDATVTSPPFTMIFRRVATKYCRSTHSSGNVEDLTRDPRLKRMTPGFPAPETHCCRSWHRGKRNIITSTARAAVRVSERAQPNSRGTPYLWQGLRGAAMYSSGMHHRGRVGKSWILHRLDTTRKKK